MIYPDGDETTAALAWTDLRNMSHDLDAVVFPTTTKFRHVGMSLLGRWDMLTNLFLLEGSGDKIEGVPVKCSLYPKKLCLIDAYPSIKVCFQSKLYRKQFDADVNYHEAVLKPLQGGYENVIRSKSTNNLIYRLQLAIQILDGNTPTIVDRDYRTIRCSTQEKE